MQPEAALYLRDYRTHPDVVQVHVLWGKTSRVHCSWTPLSNLQPVAFRGVIENFLDIKAAKIAELQAKASYVVR
jgi:hypothetical protein